MDHGKRILDQLLEVTVLLQEDMARAFAGTGLTTARTHLLWELHRLGPSTQQALAAAMDVSPRNVSGLVDALEGTGFVRRQPHPGDRRAFHVRLTPHGEQTMAAMQRAHAELGQQLVEGLGAEETDVLARGLDHVTDRLRRLVQEAADSSDQGESS